MTWKDTLNLPVSAQGEWAAKRFYGDPKLAAAYLPVAYALLGEVKNRMAYGGVSYGHRAIELPDGTRIRVIRNGEQNILEIETFPIFESSSSIGVPGIYMESGFIESFYTIDPTYQQQSRIFETASTVDEDDFIDTLELDDLPKGIRDTARSHAIPGGIDDKRYLMFHQLMTTGLLRRTIQALIGRADPAYIVPKQGEEDAGEQSPINKITEEKAAEFLFGVGEHSFRPPFDPMNIGIGLMVAMPTATRTFGLYVNDKYEYYYILIVRGAVYANPCVVSEVGSILKNPLTGDVPPEAWEPTTDEEKDRLESYLLSTLSIDKETRFLAGEIDDIVGFPVSYGWHFDKYGHRADIVTLERLEGGDIQQSRHYRIEIKDNNGYDSEKPISDSNAPLTATLKVIESVAISPPNGSLGLWTPNLILFNFSYYYWNHKGFATVLPSANAPIYCFYDTENKLVTLRLDYTTGEIESLPFSWKRDFINSVWSCDGSPVEAEKIAYKSFREGGWYITRDDSIMKDYRRDSKNGDRIHVSVSSEASGESASFEKKGYFAHTSQKANPCRYLTNEIFKSAFPFDVDSNDMVQVTVSGITVTSTVKETRQYSETARHTAFIPLLDAESFYVGILEEKRDVAYQLDYVVNGVGQSTVTYKEKGGSLTWDFPVSAVPAASGIKIIAGFTVRYGGKVTTFPTPRIDSQVVTRPAEMKIVGEFDLFYKNGVFNTASLLYTADYQDITEYYNALIGWFGIFYPILFGPNSYPFVTKPFLVNQGVTDALVCFGDPKGTLEERFLVRNIDVTTEALSITKPWQGIFTGWA